MSEQQKSRNDARIEMFFPQEEQIIFGYVSGRDRAPEQKSNGPKDEKQAEIKEQVIADAKIKIENLMRRLRVLNVDEDFLRHGTPSLRKPSFRVLYEHLTNALRETENLAPSCKLTDDESGEAD